MPWPARPRAWLIALALLVALPGAAQAACGTMNVPDAYTTPTTSPMASGGSIVIDANRCDSFGLNPYPNPGTSNPSHGTVTVDTLAGTITYTNNGDGATSDSFVVEDASNNPFTVNVAIAAATSPITVTPASLPTPNVGTPYSQQLSASGGTAPYTYAVTAGSLAPGLSLGGDTISGTPNQAGGYSVTITVTDATAATASKSYTVNIPNPSSSIAIAAPPAADLNAAYSYDLNPNTSGALAPYTYTLYSGALPPGLSLSGGIISGTPTSVGTFNFAVDVKDASPNLSGLVPGPYGKVVNLGITVQNVPPTANPVSATVAYGSTNNPVILNITGSAATSVAVAAAAAHGTAIAAGTAITYTPNPSYAGPDSFTYTATNAAGTSSPATVTITVSPPTIAYAPSSPAAATVGVAYSQSLAGATGGAAPYTYALASGALPAGLSLAPNGTLSGTPSAGGSFTFSVIAVDSSTGTGPFSATSSSLTLTVNAPTIVLSPTSLPAATTGTAYNASFSATGGTPAYTYALTAGALPAGLTLASSGTLSGTPTAAGTYNFTLAATDSSGGSGPFTGSRAYTLQVASPLVVAISSGNVSCNGGSNGFAVASVSGGVPPYIYSWSPSGGTGPSAFGLAAGTYTVTVTDSVLTTTTATVTLSQPPVLTIIPNTIAAATVGVAYSQTLSALGGTGSKVFYAGGVLPSGLSLSSAGVISGTPTTTGVFTLQIYAQDANTCVAGRNYTLAIDSPTVVLSPTSVPSGTVGAAYSQTIAASGGSAPYTYSRTAGTLPNGLALASDGTLSGTPTAGGTYSFTITATDSNGFTGSQAYLLGIDAAAIALSPTTLAAARVGSAYSETLAASGGTAPYSYAVTAGALPAGLSLSATGALAGTPTEGGSFPFTVTATDSSGGSGPYTVSRAYTLAVAAATITLTPSSLPAADAGSAYSQSFGASGGTAPYSFAITAGALPAGVSLAADGTLSGTPTASGNFTFSLTATDSSSGTGPYTATQAYTLTVAAPAITLTPATLPGAAVASPYAQTLGASGGTAPYTFAVTAGTLPAGVALAADGTLTGTPTAGGNFAVTITATDALGFYASRAYTLAVAPPVLSVGPAGLPGATAGAAYAQQLTASGGTAPYTFAVSAGALPAGLALAADGRLSGTPTASGTFVFSVTATDSSTGSGPYSATHAYTLAVAADPPVTVPDSATTLAGTAVDIAVTANDSGRIDSVALAIAPQHGSATVAGLVVRYAPAAGFSGEDSFRYVATGPGGTSAPATVTVTVHPVPVAISRTLQAIAGVETRVDLADGASGGPFTGATLVALAPANAGIATIAAEGGAWVLRFTPDPAFGGEATARFTLDNAFATSAEATITFQVQARPDPTRDAQVRGLVDAQVESARRFAQAQLGNFRQRLEQLHGTGRRGARFANGVTFAERQCAQATDRAAREACLQQRYAAQERAQGAGGPSDTEAAQADAGSGGDTTPAAFGVWAGGMIRSGRFDGRGGSGTGFESDGLSVGVDFELSPSFTLGAGLGYGRDDNRVGDAGSRLEGSARAFVAYASYHPWKHLFVDGTLGYQQLDYDASRRLAGDAGTVRGRRDGDQWFASLAVGADLQDGALQFTPYARLDVARGSLDAYTESGHPFLALRYGAMDIDSTIGNLGLRLDYRRRAGWGWFTPQLRLEYQREFADAEASLIRYADLADGPVYTLTPSAFDRNRVVFGLGATLDGDGGWSTRIEYQAQAGGQRDEGVQVNVQKDF